MWRANVLNEWCLQHGDKLLLSKCYKSYSKTHHALMQVPESLGQSETVIPVNGTYRTTLQAFHNPSSSAESLSRVKWRHLKQKNQDPGSPRRLKHGFTCKQVSDVLFSSILAHTQLVTLQEEAVILVGHRPITVMAPWKQQRKWIAEHRIPKMLLWGSS